MWDRHDRGENVPQQCLGLIDDCVCIYLWHLDVKRERGASEAIKSNSVVAHGMGRTAFAPMLVVSRALNIGDEGASS
jgi:hypothetical protein